MDSPGQRSARAVFADWSNPAQAASTAKTNQQIIFSFGFLLFPTVYKRRTFRDKSRHRPPHQRINVSQAANRRFAKMFLEEFSCGALPNNLPRLRAPYLVFQRIA